MTSSEYATEKPDPLPLSSPATNFLHAKKLDPPPPSMLYCLFLTYLETTMPTQERKVLPDLEYLRECYSYDPNTGELRWQERPLHHFQNISTQQYINKTYANTLVGVKRKKRGNGSTIKTPVGDCQLHRIIYKLHTGEEPPYIIDHKDGDQTNNRWDNLRPATAQQNVQNTLRRGYQITSTGTYRVRVRVDFGVFKTPEEAEAKYHEVVAKLHGDFYRGKVFPCPPNHEVVYYLT